MFLSWVLSVLGDGVVAAALLAGGGWLFKQQLGAWFNRDLEREKTALQKDVEALKADFNLLHTEHSVRFATLHAKRAEVIAELYSRLVEALWAAEAFLNPIEFVGSPSKAERSVEAQNRIVDARRFFERHRIYLPTVVCDALSKMLADMRSPVVHFSVYLRYTEEQMQDHTYRQYMDAWTNGYRILNEELPKARALLEAEFRTLLGDKKALP